MYDFESNAEADENEGDYHLISFQPFWREPSDAQPCFVMIMIAAVDPGRLQW